MAEELGSTGFPLSKEHILVTTERVASVISLIGCFFVMFTFLWSSRFRKPVNRLIFYATWGNLMMNIGTLISVNGILMGVDNPLCQFQGFLIQMFLPADAFWNLAMAINTYLTVFKKYNAAQCRAMEKYYLAVNFGIFFIIALVYCFITDSNNGKMYGGAVLWCWIRKPWDVFRIITCYGPAWISIVISLTIYIISGRRLYLQEKKLNMMGQSPSGSFIENPFTSYKTTEIHITSEVAAPGDLRNLASESQIELQTKIIERQYLGNQNNFDQYTVTIERRDAPIEHERHRNLNVDEIQLQTNAVKANKVAKSYALCCVLFFCSLLITWIPSSIFRVYSLFHPPTSNFGMAYATGLVLPLMGFWNTLIYVVISWDAVLDLFAGDVDSRIWKKWHGHLPSRKEWSGSDRKSAGSWGTRTRRLSLNSRDEGDSKLPKSTTQESIGDQSWLRGS